MDEQASEVKREALNGDARLHRQASLVERLAAQARKEAAKDEATPSAMAERFAPLPDDWMADASSGPAGGAVPRTVRRRMGFGPAIMSLLIAVAFIPSILVLALVAQGTIQVPDLDRLFGTTAVAQKPTTTASLAAGPMPKIAAPKVPRDAPAIVLTAPEEIEAAPGEELAFTLAIDSTDALPPRSLVAIRALPEGATLSQGRPYGSTEWTLRPDEIADLRLTLPETANSAADIRTELIAADGKLLASTTTSLIVPNPISDLVVRPQESARIDDLMGHGMKMIAVGYFAGARAYFKRAAEAGSAEAALAVGTTYDPVFIEELGAQGIRAEPEQAQVWYEKAKLLGLENPDAQIAELREAFETAAAAHEATEATLTPASEDASAKPEWVELSGGANVREGPSSNTRALRTAKRGTRFHAISRQGNWIQVTDPQTRETGWVYARYIASAQLQ